MNKEGITVAGNLIADVVYTIDVYPQKGNLTWMRNPVAHTGGINNLIIDLARLDSKIPIKVSGVVGDDENGQFIVDSLREYCKKRKNSCYICNDRKRKQAENILF